MHTRRAGRRGNVGAMDEVKGCTSTGRRRMFTALVSVVVGVGLLAACGSDDKPAASTPSTPSSVLVATSLAGATTTAGTATTVAGGAGTATTAAAGGASTAPGTTTAGKGQYTVVAGDSLFAIAKKFCISIDLLPTENGWTDGINHIIHPGDVIVIPEGACSVSTAAPSTTKAAATTTAAGAATTTTAKP